MTRPAFVPDPVQTLQLASHLGKPEAVEEEIPLHQRLQRRR